MSKRVPIGTMRQRLALDAPVETSDASGALQRTWTNIGDVWAQITAASSTDRFVADRQEEAITHRVLIRWRDGMQGEMLFRLGSRTFLIHSLFDPDERKRVLICRCEEIKP